MIKRRIAFFLADRHLGNVDCSNLEKGNPGIGGSEYLILITAQKLAQVSESLDVYLLTESINDSIGNVDGKLKRIKSVSITEIENVLIKNSIDTLILKHGNIDVNSSFFKDTKANIIIWCHNFVSRRELNLYCKLSSVKKLICVGKEQMELYLDHRAYLKSDYIYNSIPQEVIEEQKHLIVQYLDRPMNVVYMGSLTRDKSFHVLAKEWKTVLKKEPQARLFVIGSGRLYDRTSKLGKYDLADEEYENEFMQYLTNNDGSIIPSVSFLGTLGNDKFRILHNCRVGIPTPTGKSETFCLVATEMQLSGCLITAAKCSGYLDTVNPEFSELSNGTSCLAKNIVKLLHKKSISPMINEIDFIEQKFSLNKIIIEWEYLLTQGIFTNKKIHDNKHENLLYKAKWLKLICKRIKDVFPFGYYILPSSLSLNKFFKTYSC